MLRVSRAFRVGLPAAAEARRSVDELAASIPPDRLQDLRLIVSELVANAVQHAGLDAEDRIRVKLEMSTDRVRVEVIDFGRGFAANQRDPRPEEAGGWGLVIV